MCKTTTAAHPQRALTESYLRICLNSNSSAATFASLLTRYGSLAAITASPDCELWLSELEQELRQNASSNAAEIERVWQWLESGEHILILFESMEYPRLLRETDSPPPILFVAGDWRCLQVPALAIVGSRRCSVAGGRNAQWFARQCSDAGIAVVSGLANGIDSHAHRGALAGSGQTIAVLGTGIDQLYPRANLALGEQIRQRGALVSEFPLGTPPYAGNFPRRNRIVTGLCFGVLVVEAEERSGSLISARLAMEQNREVFALPGPVGARQSTGCHALIRQGAKLVDQFEHILEDLPQIQRATAEGQTDDDGETKTASGLSLAGRQILRAMQGQPCLADELQMRFGWSWPQLSSTLQELEIAGRIYQRGGRYVPASPAKKPQ